MSDEEEVELGREMARELEKDPKVELLQDASVNSYANTMIQRLAKTCRRPKISYQIKVVNTKAVNAFALPGGFLYLNRGMIEFVKTESELVGVLAHEVGHVVGRHGANAISRSSSTESILTEASRVLLGTDAPAKVLLQVGGLVGVLALLKYSRTQELEADLFGFYNMYRSNWHPQGMIDMFMLLGEHSGSLPWLTNVIGTHPEPGERAEKLRLQLNLIVSPKEKG